MIEFFFGCVAPDEEAKVQVIADWSVKAMLAAGSSDRELMREMSRGIAIEAVLLWMALEREMNEREAIRMCKCVKCGKSWEMAPLKLRNPENPGMMIRTFAVVAACPDRCDVDMDVYREPTAAEWAEWVEIRDHMVLRDQAIGGVPLQTEERRT